MKHHSKHTHNHKHYDDTKQSEARIQKKKKKKKKKKNTHTHTLTGSGWAHNTGIDQCANYLKNRKEGNDQESIQSSHNLPSETSKLKPSEKGAGSKAMNHNLVNNYACSLSQNNQVVTFRKVSLTNYLPLSIDCQHEIRMSIDFPFFTRKWPFRLPVCFLAQLPSGKRSTIKKQNDFFFYNRLPFSRNTTQFWNMCLL